MTDKTRLTTATGNPVTDNQNSLTAGERAHFYKADPAYAQGIAKRIGISQEELLSFSK